MAKPGYKFPMKYIEQIIERYHKLDRVGKSKIIEEAVRITGYNRKYLIAILNSPFISEKAKCGVITGRGRRKVYGWRIKEVIKQVWERSNYPWSVRLKKIIEDWILWIKEEYDLDDQVIQSILNISPASIDRLLKQDRIAIKKRIYGRTKPSSLIKREIPISTHFDNNIGAGHIEIDLVAHCGQSAMGEFFYTLNAVDIYSGWDESVCLANKGEDTVKTALADIMRYLPFKVVSIDSDNGSEFINWQLYKYCKLEGINFTRSRPYKKDDNAHIEQKNWTNVRKILGWDRYRSEKSLKLINDLYRNELRLFMNLFMPSVKLIKTQRVGSRIKKYYDRPKTPYQRLIERYPGNEKLIEPGRIREKINPFDLINVINDKLNKIYASRSKNIPESINNLREKRLLAEVEKLLKKEVVHG